ncbi:MAG TPA: ABC transporter permease [Luteitalea sp.]|nr:ABC transporter permease [Luteitalea sp.]
MTALTQVVRRLAASMRRTRPVDRLEEELALHLEEQIADNLRAGLPPAEARRQARLKIGSLDATREHYRDTQGLPIVDRLIADLGYAARGTVRSPAFTLAVVAMLAIGIGASTATFSVVNTVLLRPLPFDEPDRLVRLFTVLPSGRLFDASPGKFYDWQRHAQSFERMAPYPCCGVRHLALGGTGTARSVATTSVGADFFDVVRTRPALGRTFRPDDDTPDGKRVAVISHRLWQTEFAGDENVLGRALRLDDEPYVVIGVLGSDAELASWSPMASDAWIPLGLGGEARTSRGNHYLDAVARLRPGIDVAQAQREMTAIAAQLGRDHQRTDLGWGVRVVGLREQIGGASRTTLLLLLGAVTLLQLIACANVANLLFTRAVARRKELALRAALGAGRRRIFQQLLTEAVLLATAGGLAGVGVAVAALRLSSTLLATHVPRASEIAIDARVLLFAVALSMASGILSGTLPAWRAGRTDLNDALKQGGRGDSAVGIRTRRGLVACEVGLSLILLMGASVLLQSLLRLRDVDAGFNPDNVITMRVGLVPARYPTPERRAAFFDEALCRLRTLPGVESAGTINNLPFTSGDAQTLTLEGYAAKPQPNAVQVRQISDQYLATMQIPVLRGREARSGDEDVLIVSRRAAAIYWGTDDPIGRRASLNGISPELRTVVGLVGDVKQRSLTEETIPTVYWYSRAPYARTTVAVRTSVPPTSIVPAVLSVIRDLDPEQPVQDIRTMLDVRDEQLAPQRLSATLLGVFAVVALLLAGIGIYGVLAYIVRGRDHEIAVRTALGAQSSDVLRLVLLEGLPAVAAGIAGGIVGTLASARVLGSLLFEASPSDPWLLVAAAATLLVVSMLAAAVPAYRALRLDPAAVLH